MTHAVFAKNNGFHRISIKGHADYSSPDIVCAAASMLACTLVSMISCISGASSSISDGCVTASVKSSEKTDVIVSTIKRGFELLSEKYPKNVTLFKEINYEKNYRKADT